MSVLFSVQDHVARVTIDRPERHNAVDQATEAELIRIWETIEKDRDIRVVVLTGAGTRAFCTGADMKGGSGLSGLEYWARPRPGGFGGIALRDTLDVPVIARVNGYALGGGMEMMLGCDIVVASADATFGLPEPRVGRLALDGGIALLARRIPHVQAMGMLLTGRRIAADEALRYGLVNEVVAPDELDQAVGRWVADILACAPLSVRAIKQMVRAGERVSAKEAQMLRLPALVEALQSSDQDEGVRRLQGEARAAMARALRRRKPVMAYVIASTCIDVKDGACQEACPVECIYEGGRMMYIQPDECIDCGLCLSVCPVDAIYVSEDLPESEHAFELANAEFFGPAITGWGSPGGADSAHVSALDHPLVAIRAK